MFSTLPRKTNRDVVNQGYAQRALVILSIFTATAGCALADYQYPTEEAKVRLLERVEHLRTGACIEQVHQTWLILMLLDGWKYGPSYCTHDRTDPAMVEFKELNHHRVLSDSLIRDVVLKTS